MPFRNLTMDEKFNTIIRVFFYIMVFWLPYSPAVIESCVIISALLWLIKRIVVNWALILSGPRNVMKALRPPIDALNGWIYAFLLVGIISAASSIFWQSALADLVTKLLEWFAVFWLIKEAFTDKKQIQLLISIMLFSATAVALDALFQFYISGKDIFNGNPISPDGRATASFKAPSGLGTYLLSMLPLLFARALSDQKRLWKIVYSLLVCLFIFSLALTFTRGAWFGALVGILTFYFTYLIWSRHFEFVKTIALVLIFLSIIAAFPLVLNTQTTLKLIKRSNTVHWRVNVWKDSLEMIKDRPLVGHGVNTYMKIFQAYRRDPQNAPTYAHNCFIQLTTELGLAGLFLFCGIIFRFFLNGYFCLKKSGIRSIELAILSIGLLSAVWGYLSHSMFDTNLYALQLGILLWLMIGIQNKLNQIMTEGA